MTPTPDRWRTVEALYHAALECDPAARVAFLDGSCGQDADLRSEVDALLAEASKGRGLLDRPVAELLAVFGTIELTSGSRLGPYQIEGLIGEGGMGRVYRARDTRLGRTVAIKTSSARFTERFEREARAVASLNHPHICHLYDVGPDYLVMEYIEGAPLKGPLPVGEALKYAIQICDALDAAHKSGIVHRDLKPANILLSKQGTKLLDFGLAQMEIGPDDATMTQMTQAGAVMGTPAYMAPEQWDGKRADARSDIYSFGCVLCEMLTGKRAAGRPGGEIRPGAEASPELDRILSKCLENDPELRYQHASEIRTDLRRLKRDGTTSAKPVASTDWAKRWNTIVPVAALVLFAAGYFYLPRMLHGSPKLTDKDTIVLGDFVNTTGDPVFDDTLRQGLSVELEQSPFLSLVSDQNVRKTLVLMGQPKDAPLTPEVAQQVCERTSGAAVLEGSIALLGSQYVLGLRAKSCGNGNILDEEQTQAAKKEDVLDSLSRIARTFRTRIGESLATVERHSTPLAEATTPSLEALKAYSAAMKVNISSGGPAAVPLFKRAVELDPEFAMAYANLGLAYTEPVLAAESTTTAWRLRNHASDREKFFIEFTYNRQVTGDLEQAFQTLQLWAQTYPRGAQPDPHSLMGGLSVRGTGRWEVAIEQSKASIASDPDVVFGYTGLAESYLSTDRFKEARVTLQRASVRKLEMADFPVVQYIMACLEGDKNGMDQAIALARGKRQADHWITHEEALAHARLGQLEQARLSSRRAVDLARQERGNEAAATYIAARAVWEAIEGQTAEAKQDATGVLTLSTARDVEYAAALALALAGELAQPETLAADLEKRFPEDTFVRFTYSPVLRASVALARGQPARAADFLQTAVAYENAVNGLNFNYYLGGLYSAWVRGEAFLTEQRPAQAIAEFQKILDRRGIVGLDPIGTLAHLQLGRAFVMAGNKTGATTEYRDFLTLWKDADPDIPILRQAKAEYARLQ